MTHDEICERARRWLRGTKRCNPVFSNVASCGEIPDAIGWSSAWKMRGSIVVEAKTSVADFHADKWKYVKFKHPEFDPVDVPAMGDFRYFMCVAGVLPLELVERVRPDHGLLWIDGRKVRVIREAPKREEATVNLRSEIRYLRFAIINSKKPYTSSDSPSLQPELFA